VRSSASIAPGGARIPVLSAADILTNLEERESNAGIESVSAWLRHLVIRTPDLDSAVAENPKAAPLQRLADMANTLNNVTLTRQLDSAARRISARINSPSRTGVGTRIQVPQILQNAPRGTGSPWMDEQTMRLARQEAEVQQVIGTAMETLPTFPWRTLGANAGQVKAYDAYHSTTMEGYRISREISDAIVRGDPLPGGPQSQETLQAAMAIQGYLVAFSEVLARA
jgi:hypothetical protein